MELLKGDVTYGLYDNNRTFDKEVQKYWFEKQLSLSKLLHIPVIIQSYLGTSSPFL